MKKIVFSILIAGLLVASCCIAGYIIINSPDPIIGIYDDEPYSTFDGYTELMMVEENGIISSVIVLPDGSAGKTPIGSWNNTGNGTYSITRYTNIYENCVLSPDYSTITTSRKTYMRNTSFVMPEVKLTDSDPIVGTFVSPPSRYGGRITIMKFESNGSMTYYFQDPKPPLYLFPEWGWKKTGNHEYALSYPEYLKNESRPNYQPLNYQDISIELSPDYSLFMISGIPYVRNDSYTIQEELYVFPEEYL